MNRPAKGSRLITCHLGNGASICAVRDGISIDTSMGFTPLEGVMMGTRSGDIDAGLVLHLITAMKMSPSAVDQLLNHESGLLGISGKSADMRDLEKAADTGNEQVTLALEMYAYRIRKYIGAYAAAMGGVDAIAFAGGVGEHSASMRQSICRDLGFLNALLDETLNRGARADQPTPIHRQASTTQLWVVPTDEELQIAREIKQLLS
jgi:acetate kinase